MNTHSPCFTITRDMHNAKITRRNSIFHVLVLACLCSIAKIGNASEQCVYPDKREKGGLAAHDKCGVIKGDSIELEKSHLDQLVFDENGLACIIFSGEQAFYVHKDSRSRRVYLFDNGCDYFEHGLARAIINKRTTFIDSSLNVVLDTGFEWVEPFDYGHVVVCNGPFSKKNIGEHTLLTDGKCGLMNKEGKLVVDAKYAIGERMAFDLYLNSHNHCPPPPIKDEQAALCHAKRHVANMDGYTGEWERYSVAKKADEWLITFKEKKADEEMILSISVETAQWHSLVPQAEN